EAYLVPEAVFSQWATAQADLGRLRQALPLLMAAVSAGAAIPSETLRAIGIEYEFDWEKLNAFQATFPISITHDETGKPLPHLSSAMPVPTHESDDEIKWRDAPE